MGHDTIPRIVMVREPLYGVATLLTLMMKEETRLEMLQEVEQVTPAGILLLEFFLEFFQKRGTVMLTRPPSGMATDGERLRVRLEL